MNCRSPVAISIFLSTDLLELLKSAGIFSPLISQFPSLYLHYLVICSLPELLLPPSPPVVSAWQSFYGSCCRAAVVHCEFIVRFDVLVETEIEIEDEEAGHSEKVTAEDKKRYIQTVEKESQSFTFYTLNKWKTAWPSADTAGKECPVFGWWGKLQKRSLWRENHVTSAEGSLWG